MALIFTDEQIQNLTKDALLLPAIIDDPVNGTGLVQQKEQLLIVKDNLEKTDSQNSVYSDNFIVISQAYHDELLEIKGESRTTYNNADLLAGGEGKAPHWTLTHFSMVPLLLASNNGNPRNLSAQDSETSRILDVEDAIDELKNGFVNGALDDTATTAPSGGVVEVDTGGFVIGNIIVIDDSGNDLLGLVTSIDPPTTTGVEDVSYTIITGSESGMITGARVRNFHPGFNNSERGHQSSPDAPNYQAYLEGIINTEVNEWETNLSGQKIAIESNDDLGTGETQNATALTNVDSAILAITTWEAIIIIDVAGRYTDVSLAPLETKLNDRENTEIPARETEISTSLGSVAQAGDGSFSGTGIYFDLFGWVDIRIAKSGGSLYAQKSIDLGVEFFDQRITKSQKQLDDYNATFVITKIVGDTDIGEIEFEVESPTGLAVTNQIKIMDNDSVVFTRIIDTIVSNDIRLDSGISAALLESALARIVRQK